MNYKYQFTYFLSIPYFLIIGFITCFSLLSSAQTIQEEFGKNRIQYHDFKWFEYESDNFRVYWAGDTKVLGQAVVQIAEWDYSEIQEILEHRINRKIELIVYKDITDLKQSNIGNEETFVNIGGQTKIAGNKVFVYFDGNHNHLRQQIREGIAKVYVNNMMFGNSFQEVVQNAVLLNLPPWFSDGLVSYIGKKWDAELDNQLKDIITSNKYSSFEKFAAAEPKLAGHSLWYYIDNNYGTATASNLIYLTRINRSVESGFLYVLGSPYSRTIISWRDYFNERYATKIIPATPSDSLQIDIKNRKKLPINHLKISPNGKKIAYATNEKGKIKVIVQEVESGKKEVVFNTGYRNHIQATDYNYPLISWSLDNQFLGIIYEKRDVIKFTQINVDSKIETEDNIAPKYQRIYNLEYINSNELLISGTLKGLSDIFIYRINQKSSKSITNDFYDDLDPIYTHLNGEKGILFASNRGDDLRTIPQKLDTILPIQNFDIYFYSLEEKENKELIRITNTPYANEKNPIRIDSFHYAYLSDKNGIYNQYVGELEKYLSHKERVVVLKTGEEVILSLDSIPNTNLPEIDTTFVRNIYKWKGKNHPVSNYNRNIVEAHSSRTGKLVQNFYHNGIHKLFISDTPIEKIELKNVDFKTQFLEKKSTEDEGKNLEESSENNTPEPENNDENNNSWEFDTDFDRLDEEEPKEEENKTTTTPTKEYDYDFVTDYLDPEEENKKEEVIIPNEEIVVEQDTDIIDIDNYQFESDFETDVPDAAVIIEDEEGQITLQSPNITHAKESFSKEQKKVHKFRVTQIVGQRLKFKSNTITTQLDNSLLFGGLDIYTGNPYNYPAPGILIKSSVQDLFEDYELEGGFRVPTSFDGLEYFVTFKDDKKRLDKSYTYYKKTSRTTFDANTIIITLPNGNSTGPNPVPYKLKEATDLLQVRLKYPLDIYGSFRAIISARNDKLQFLSNDRTTLEELPPQNEQRLGLRLEYVFDNTVDIDVNIKNGFRLKAYTEVYQKMDISFNNGFNWDFNKGVLGLIGTDIRYYQRLGKHAVFASRVSAATSFGSEKMLFFLGGTENSLFPTFNNNIPLPSPETTSFAYQTMASPLRGFATNIRNGNSFILGNLELRVPIFKYLFQKPIKSGFIRNFQFVSFFDVGTAWQGLSPFSEDNPLNTATITNPPGVISVTVNYYRDPIVASFGGGVRTKLFGYFIRVDYAKGIETKIVQPGVWHVSLGTDF